MATVTVIYKSGQKVRFKCKSFTATINNGEVIEVKWDTAQPKPLFFGVNDIESIWEGKV